LCSQRIDPASTAEFLAEAIACAERSGDRYFSATLQNNAGVVALEAGDVPAALSHLEQAIQARLAIGSMIQHVSSNLGWVLREQGDGEGARSKFDEALRLSRRSGDRSGTAYATLGLACLAADRDDWHRGALLHGTAQAFLDGTGEPWQRLEAHYREVSLDTLRARLTDEEFQRAYAKGKRLSVEEAFDLALGRLRSS